MAESSESKDDVLLIAQVRAFLLNGETVELLPFKHEEDVRGEVNKFIEDWVKTGFLLQGPFLYPWQQVKAVEVVSVQAMTRTQARPYLDDWQRDTEAQKVFWKTRKPSGDKDGKDPEKKDEKKS
jgi:hypothetical protein